jgi:Phage tail tube protein
MASEDSLIGNDWVVQIGDATTPPTVYTDMCSVFDFGSVGEEKPLVDVTTYCDTARTYRNGLADGTEIPLQMNYIPGDEFAKQLYDAYKTDSLVHIKIKHKDSIAPDEESFTYDATVRAWNVTGPIGDKSVLQFTLKVSGEILWQQAA